MKYRRQRTVAGLALLAAVAASVLAYPDLPEQMATHWGPGGNVDDTMPKSVGAFALPVIGAFVVAVMYVVPRIDPRKQHYQAFRGAYEWFIAGMAALLAYVHGLVLAWNLGHQLPIGRALAPPLALLLYGIGLLLERVESNWFVGIRTPWTLADDAVWEETHQKGAVAFKIAGIAVLGGVVFPEYYLAFVLAPVLLAAAYAVAYSFLAYRRRHGSDGEALR